MELEEKQLEELQEEQLLEHWEQGMQEEHQLKPKVHGSKGN